MNRDDTQISPEVLQIQLMFVNLKTACEILRHRYLDILEDEFHSPSTLKTYNQLLNPRGTDFNLFHFSEHVKQEIKEENVSSRANSSYANQNIIETYSNYHSASYQLNHSAQLDSMEKSESASRRRRSHINHLDVSMQYSPPFKIFAPHLRAPRTKLWKTYYESQFNHPESNLESKILFITQPSEYLRKKGIETWSTNDISRLEYSFSNEQRLDDPQSQIQHLSHPLSQSQPQSQFQFQSQHFYTIMNHGDMEMVSSPESIHSEEWCMHDTPPAPQNTLMRDHFNIYLNENSRLEGLLELMQQFLK